MYLASSGKEIRENFEKNEFSITRQVAYSMTNPREELGMVIFINGLAVINIKLKNPCTGQNARVHGVNQYKNQRDNKQPLLQFGRCLVDFAADLDEIFMVSFNEKWFQGWEATPEEQRVKFVSIARLVQEYANFKTHYVDNPDIQNRDLALMKMIGDAISKQRKNELEMYKLYSQDDAFRTALQNSIRRLVGL